MQVILILISIIYVKYCESCYCLKCNVSPSHMSTLEFADEKDCANSINGDNTETKSCHKACYSYFTIKYDRLTVKEHLMTNGDLKVFKYTIDRGCSDDYEQQNCIKIPNKNEGKENEIEFECVVTDDGNYGNSIDLTMVIANQVENVIEMCASCDVPYEDNICLVENQVGTMCTGGICFIRITFDMDKLVRFQRGCLIDFHSNIESIVSQKSIVFTNAIYPNADENIESWGVCKPILYLLCNKIGIIFNGSAKVDIQLKDKAVKIYKNMKLWNYCIYCYSTDINSLCTKGKIRFKISDVIVCYGKCLLMFNIKIGKNNSNEFEIMRSCTIKRDKHGGKVGGLNPNIEKMTNKYKLLGCTAKNGKNRICRTICKDSEQHKEFCNKWQLHKLLLTPDKAIYVFEQRAVYLYGIQKREGPPTKSTTTSKIEFQYTKAMNKTTSKVINRTEIIQSSEKIPTMETESPKEKTTSIASIITTTENLTPNDDFYDKSIEDMFNAEHDIRSEIMEVERISKERFFSRVNKKLWKRPNKKNMYFYYGIAVLVFVVIGILIIIGHLRSSKEKKKQQTDYQIEEYKKQSDYNVSNYNNTQTQNYSKL